MTYLKTRSARRTILHIGLAVVLTASASTASAQGGGPKFSLPSAIAVEADGSIMVAASGSNRSIIRVDPVTGDRVLLQEKGLCTGPLITVPGGVAAEANGDLVVTDSSGTGSGEIVRIDAVSGDRTIVSGPFTGSGTTLGLFIGDIIVDASGDLLTADGSRVFRVDPATGDRVVVSGGATGAGPPISGVHNVALEASGDIVVTDSQHLRVVRIDPVTGDRTIVSDAGTGTGPAWVSPIAISVVASGDLVVLDRDLGAVVRVDAVTGDRTVVSDAVTGTGPLLGDPRGLAVEASGDLLVVDRSLNAVVRVDPSTGDRTLVSSGTARYGSVAAEASGAPIVIDSELNAVVRVDPSNGDASTLSGAGFGAGPGFGSLRDIAVEASGDVVVADDPFAPNATILRIDPVTGDRVVVSDTVTGAGPAFDDLTTIAVEPSGDLVVGDRIQAALLRVDPVTGDRSIVSGLGVGSGPTATPSRIAVEASGAILVLDADDDALYRVDPVTGDRSVISDEHTGSGTEFTAVRGLAIEATGDIVVVDGFRGVFRVDPVTGDRFIVSGSSRGAGPLLIDERDVSVDAGGDLLVVDLVRETMIRVDPESGDRSLLKQFTPPFGCPSAPTAGCTTGFEKGKLIVVEKSPGREKITASLSKGPAFTQLDVGNPTLLGCTALALCVYDDGGALVADLPVDRAGSECPPGKPCWKAIGGALPTGTGFLYKDKDASAAGLGKIKIKGGDAGKSKITVKAANNANKGQTSMPTGVAAALTGTTSVQVQVFSTNDACFEATLSDISVQQSFLFKAK